MAKKMINQIRLENFQGHVDTRIDLVPGVNVITGQSDAGKSSIVRALWWLLNNRPSGAGVIFRHHDADEKDVVGVSVVVDDGSVVARFRKGSDNAYAVKGVVLRAIKQDVPT